MRFAFILALLLACNTNKKDEETSQKASSLDPGTGITLDQNWTDAGREVWLYMSQGSQVIPYKWFLHLEQANSEELFRSEKNMNRLRFIVAEPTRLNPDGLPIGLAKDIDKFTKQEFVGFTCAACHTAQVQYKGTALHVDGAPAMIDYNGFVQGMYDGLKKTHDDEDKLNRFARRILEGDMSIENRDKLKVVLAFTIEQIRKRIELNESPVAYGPARVDALGAIFNQVTVEHLNIPDNKRASDAPVSYPFLWGAHQSDWVQWNGSLPNGDGGAPTLLRNTGELLGVWGNILLVSEPGEEEEGYYSSVKVANLSKLEDYSKDLRSPQWPEIFPEIDQNLAGIGEKLYQQKCASCHEVIPRDQQGEKYKAKMVKASVVGTDPTLVENFFKKRRSGRLSGQKVNVFFGDEVGSTILPNDAVGHAAVGAIIKHPLGDYLKGDQTGEDITVEKPPHDLKSYKARPLTGIWATAPYLHNGSVPNLYELLKPAAERQATFWVGSREFDPKKVGFVSTEDSKFFRFDTSLKGNRNTGHEYGRGLTDRQRYQLIEYLKTL